VVKAVCWHKTILVSNEVGANTSYGSQYAWGEYVVFCTKYRLLETKARKKTKEDMASEIDEVKNISVIRITCNQVIMVTSVFF
jgi:hypothetical protein